MIDIRKRIAVIETLLDGESIENLTYAALECRLTIEQLCYDRLRHVLDLTSYTDLKGWTPKAVVRQVVEEANDLASTGLTLWMSKEPLSNVLDSLTPADYEELEYVKVGTQAELPFSKLGRLWQELSGAALHVRLPTDQGSRLEPYGPTESIRKRVIATLKELEKLSVETMIIGSPKPTYSFKCDGCGALIKRIEPLLMHGQTVSCPRDDECKESYLIFKEREETLHARRVVNLICDYCSASEEIPFATVNKLKIGERLPYRCGSCDYLNIIRMIPVREKIHQPRKA
ncbi:hypothetical protein ACTXGQ_18805 [Marinobacter sp. 1Y8]